MKQGKLERLILRLHKIIINAKMLFGLRQGMRMLMPSKTSVSCYSVRDTATCLGVLMVFTRLIAPMLQRDRVALDGER
jgi:hypothetical protein